MKSVKVVTAAASVSAVATVVAPPASAMMLLGNYDVLTNRYTEASWVWFVVAVSAPRPRTAWTSARYRD